MDDTTPLLTAFASAFIANNRLFSLHFADTSLGAELLLTCIGIFGPAKT